VARVGCAALTDHLRAVAWPSKFRPHLPKKYNGSTNPSEFLQVYITAITTAGCNDAVMASYFHVALTGPAQTWLMNLTPGSIQSWGELCVLFMVWRPTSTLSRSNPGKPSGPSSPASPRYVEPFHVLSMHLLSRLSDRGSVTRRCWRSWRHTRWKLSPPCSP
jgi:hypothetical protein